MTSILRYPEPEPDPVALFIAQAVKPKARRTSSSLVPQSIYEPLPSGGNGKQSKPLTLTQLLDHQDEEYDWLIDDLLEREDRVVLTGKEGEGKSTLLRQIGIAAAAGVHPFTLEPIDPLRVLDIDCENSQRQLRREFARALLPVADKDVLDRFYVQTVTEGLVLDIGKDPDGDRAMVERLIKECSPQLVILGPVYKLIAGVANDEEPNRELVKFLDRLRTRYHFAILLEAHTPHDAKRPYGWSGWKRWPEFGLHLDEGGELSRWRGDRDARAWPERLGRGGKDGWLWTAGGPSPEPSRDPHEIAIQDAGIDVLKAMRRTHQSKREDKRLTRAEVLERVSRRKAVALVAFTRLLDQGAFIVTKEERTDLMGRTYEVELFEIDPAGPYSETKQSRK